MIAVICILILIIAIGTYGIINLLKQLEQLEDQVSFYIDVVDTVREKVLDVQVQLKEIDIKGSFEADDEVGFVFKEIKELADDLTNTINEAYER
jgi:predicted PurR-regulated permease PerM